MHRSALFALLLSGCWLSNSEILDRYDTDADTTNVDGDTGQGTDVVVDGSTTVVLALDPAFGTDAGGLTTVITVDEVGPDAVVRIGGQEASIVGTTTTTLTVVTPPGTTGGAVVQVSSGGETGSLTDGYWYWADGDGEYGTLGGVFYLDYTGDLTRLGYIDRGSAAFQLVEPTSDGMAANYGGAMDQCVSAATGGDRTALDLHDWSLNYRNDSGGIVPLTYEDEEDAYTAELGEVYVGANRVYDLVLPTGTAPFPAFEIVGAVRTPPTFVVSTPDFTQEHLLDPGLGADVNMDLTLAWTGTGAGDYMLVDLIRWEYNLVSNSYVIAERVRCQVMDDGFFTVPAATWDSWSIGAPIDIYLARVETSEFELPHNRSTNGLVGRYRVGGTAWQSIF